MSKARKLDQRLLLGIVIVALVAVVGIINPRFVTLNNLIAIFQQIAVLGVLTMAMSMLLISGGIDLSIGSMMTLSAVVVATILMRGGGMASALAVTCTSRGFSGATMVASLMANVPRTFEIIMWRTLKEISLWLGSSTQVPGL